MYQGKRAHTAPIIAEWARDHNSKTSDVVTKADSYTQFVNGQ